MGGWDLARLSADSLWPSRGGAWLGAALHRPADPDADTAGFAALDTQLPIPLVADESCWDLADLLRLASPCGMGETSSCGKNRRVRGPWLMAQTARRLGLDLMLGCYSDSPLLNWRAAQLLPLVRWPVSTAISNLINDRFRTRSLRRPGAALRLAPGLGGSPQRRC